MKHRDEILRLRGEGKTYNEIVELLGCSKGTISYHCGKNQKEKSSQRKNKNKKINPLSAKIGQFKDYRTKEAKSLKNRVHKFYQYSDTDKQNFSLKDLKEKIGENPICYLTGKPINLDDPQSYELDHIIPVSRGGDNSLENCNICLTNANRSKERMILEEYLELCKTVLQNFNYKVEDPKSL